MEEFRDPGLLSDRELDELVAAYAAELRWLCECRWVLFDQLDVMRAEHIRRLRTSYGRPRTTSAVTRRRPLFTGTGIVYEVVVKPPPALPDVTRLDDEDLRDRLRATKSVEDDVSLRRQVVWHRLEVLRSEQRYRRPHG